MSYARSRSSMRRVAMALGSIDDLSDAVANAPDPRTAYVNWAAAVKNYGGVVTVTPHVNAGVAAARYPVAFVFPNAPNTTLNSLFSKLPDDWSDDGNYVYYIAPAAVLQYTAPSGGIMQPQSVPGEPVPPMPQWYDNLLGGLKAGGWILGGIAALALLSFLPRSRSS